MNTLNYTVNRTADIRTNLGTLANHKADQFTRLAAEGTITAPAAAFARQLNAVALFLEALSIGNEAKTYNAL